MLMHHIDMSMHEGPPKDPILRNSKGVSSLIDEFPDIDRSRGYFLPMFMTEDLDIVPWGLVGSSDACLEFLFSVYVWIVYPLLMGEVLVVCPDQFLAEVECCNLLGSELAGENLEVIAEWRGSYVREARLAMKRLLLR
jgi:hypothetical protein